ncbi:MAG: CRISPR-associated endoribonuclease Cas6, partial [Armatimonadota bacterium]|nr:CRISPR-associated endoribonuclease Cas6 [Armatimonadota bacterium]
MRLHFELSPNQQTVPFGYQHFLTGAFNKWLGRNKVHDDISLYSLSWLSGGNGAEGGLNFPHGAMWFISAHDQTLLQTISDRALREPEVCCGMRVVKILQQRTPNFGNYYAFKVASPVLARGK